MEAQFSNQVPCFCAWLLPQVVPQPWFSCLGIGSLGQCWSCPSIVIGALHPYFCWCIVTRLERGYVCVCCVHFLCFKVGHLKNVPVSIKRSVSQLTIGRAFEHSLMLWKCYAADEPDRHLKLLSLTWPKITGRFKFDSFSDDGFQIFWVTDRDCWMEKTGTMMEACKSSLNSEIMEQFPFKYPKIFTSILLHCGTRDIHSIRSSFKSSILWTDNVFQVHFL